MFGSITQVWNTTINSNSAVEIARIQKTTSLKRATYKINCNKTFVRSSDVKITAGKGGNVDANSYESIMLQDCTIKNIFFEIGMHFLL